MTCGTSGSLHHRYFCSGFTDIHTTTWSNISHEKTINLPCVPTFCVYYYGYDFDFHYAYFANTFLQAPSIDKPCGLVAVGLGTRIVLWELFGGRREQLKRVRNQSDHFRSLFSYTDPQNPDRTDDSQKRSITRAWGQKCSQNKRNKVNF